MVHDTSESDQQIEDSQKMKGRRSILYTCISKNIAFSPHNYGQPFFSWDYSFSFGSWPDD